MKRRWPLATLMAGCGVVAGYAAWVGPNGGRWMFGVFALFFLGLAAVPFFPESRLAARPAATVETRFTSHWGIWLAVILLGVSLLLGACHLLRSFFS